MWWLVKGQTSRLGDPSDPRQRARMHPPQEYIYSNLCAVLQDRFEVDARGSQTKPNQTRLYRGADCGCRSAFPSTARVHTANPAVEYTARCHREY